MYLQTLSFPVAARDSTLIAFSILLMMPSAGGRRPVLMMFASAMDGSGPVPPLPGLLLGPPRLLLLGLLKREAGPEVTNRRGW